MNKNNRPVQGSKESNDLNEKFDFSNNERDNNFFDDKKKMVGFEI